MGAAGPDVGGERWGWARTIILPVAENPIGRPDVATTASVAVVAYALSTLIHEGLGHGGACVAVGCVPQLLTSMQFQGNDSGLSVGAVKLIAAGGTVANLIAAAVAILLLRRERTSTGGSWFFLWLLATVNLFQATGYPLYSGMGGIGDWAAVIDGLNPVWFWRIALIVVGAATYWLAVRWSMARLGERLSGIGSARVSEANRYTLVSYLAGGALAVAAGAFDPGGAGLVLISGAAATLGGTSALAWGPQLLHDLPIGKEEPRLALPRDWRWIIGAIACLAVFVFVLGRGIRLAAR